MDHNKNPDDHIWLTVAGGTWAIRAIERTEIGETVFHLWRGYIPALDFATFIIDKHFPWEDYCNRAAYMLEKEFDNATESK